MESSRGELGRTHVSVVNKIRYPLLVIEFFLKYFKAHTVILSTTLIQFPFYSTAGFPNFHYWVTDYQDLAKKENIKKLTNVRIKYDTLGFIGLICS